MNQLTTTNQFKLEETLMQKVLEASGYQFTIINPNDSEPHFIAQEVADSLGYARNDYLTKQFKPKGLPLFKLTYDNGLIELKEVLKKATDLKAFAFSKLKMTTHLILIPSSSLEEYLIIYARKPDAKELGKKLLDYFRQGYKVKPIIIKDDLDEALNEQLMKIFPTYSESIEVSKEIQGLFAGWYFKRVFKTAYLRRWNRSERIYNWLMSQSLGFYFFFHWRYNQSKFNSQQKQDSRNLLYFAVLRKPANFKAITTP